MGKVTFGNKPNKYYNFSGRMVWESRSPAVVGVIIAKCKGEDYVLISQRGEGAADNHGLWNVPCGYLDWNETGTDGVIREIHEETGVYVYDLKKIKHNNLEQPFYVNTDTQENKQNVSLSYGLYFKCKELPDTSLEFCEPNEVSAALWVKVSDFEKYDYAFHHRERILSYIKIINNNKKDYKKTIKKFLKKNWVFIACMLPFLFLFSFRFGFKDGSLMTIAITGFYWFLYKL